MTPKLTASSALEELATQHAMLREMMERCEELAEEVDAGSSAPAQLLREVARLRSTFDAHNQFEEQLLRPLLLNVDWLGAVRMSRMVEDHVEEHRVLRSELRATPTAELRKVIADLRDHLATEERYFLSRKVLRDDLAR
jgi:iron-sulfur cluster repair protein YtfE (RIC family)